MRIHWRALEIMRRKPLFLILSFILGNSTHGRSKTHLNRLKSVILKFWLLQLKKR
jgi:hypothetical protein